MSSLPAPSFLFIVTGDPRTSRRPAEAIRVAAGIAAWKRVDVKVYLHGPAVRALGEWVDDLQDEDNYTRYLPMLAEQTHPFYVEGTAAELGELGESTYRMETVSSSGLADLVSRATSTLHF